LNQSFWLVLLQIFGVITGTVSIFYVAGSIPAEQYSIVGINQIIISIVVVFSNTGLETHAQRNILAWKQNDQIDNIVEIISQSIFMRLIFSVALLPFVLFYLSLISHYKYQDEHFTLFIVMALFSSCQAITSSIILVFRAFNQYLSAAIYFYTANILSRIIAIIVFSFFGFYSYMYMIMLIPLFIMIIGLWRLRDYIKINHVIHFHDIKKNMILSKFYLVSSYLSYLLTQLDFLIVSILYPVEIIGAYGIAKRLSGMGDELIKNIFNPPIQFLTKFRSDLKRVERGYKKIKRLQKITLFLSIPLFLGLIYYLPFGITKLNLGKYHLLETLIITVYISKVMHLLAKVKLTFVGAFYAPRYYFQSSVIMAVISVVSVLILAAFIPEYIALSGGISHLFVYLYLSLIFIREKQMNGIVSQ
jgi:O-antigen/teichoic acid export membrane protein